MAPRWKGMDFAAIAESNPMSQIITQLQCSLKLSQAHAMLAGNSILFEATPELADLLNCSSFGREISTSDKTKQWLQLGLEEAFYLHHELGALTIAKENDASLSTDELWGYMRAKAPLFPVLFKVYVHLRAKNWVVRSGTQYGGDFVAYHHHPALVHSEYVVIVLLEGDGCAGESNVRLRVWSDLQCSLRVCGNVAKTLLVLSRSENGGDVSQPSCLGQFMVEESLIERWVPEQCREKN